MAVSFDDIPQEMKEQIQTALSEWVDSLSDEQARSPVIQLFSTGFGPKQSYAPCYSPSNIRDEVTAKTDFGRQYVEALYELHERMKLRDPEASIIGLIRRSIRRRPVSI